VLNLGVDGFGAIGATAKSQELAERYPPACAVYLFSPNDLDTILARRPWRSSSTATSSPGAARA
jgi:hypothetical protein